MSDEALLRAIAADATVGSARDEAMRQVADRAVRRRRWDRMVVAATAVLIVTVIAPITLSLAFNGDLVRLFGPGTVLPQAELWVIGIWLLGHFAFGSGMLLCLAALVLVFPSFVGRRQVWFLRDLPRGLPRWGALVGAVCAVVVAFSFCLPLAIEAFDRAGAAIAATGSW